MNVKENHLEFNLGYIVITHYNDNKVLETQNIREIPITIIEINKKYKKI